MASDAARNSAALVDLIRRFDLCDDYDNVWETDFLHSGQSSKPAKYDSCPRSGGRPALAKKVTHSGKSPESERGKAVLVPNFSAYAKR